MLEGVDGGGAGASSLAPSDYHLQFTPPERPAPTASHSSTLRRVRGRRASCALPPHCLKKKARGGRARVTHRRAPTRARSGARPGPTRRRRSPSRCRRDSGQAAGRAAARSDRNLIRGPWSVRRSATRKRARASSTLTPIHTLPGHSRNGRELTQPRVIAWSAPGTCASRPVA